MGEATSGARPWHARSGAEVLAELGSGPDGLTDAEARARLDRHGPNELPRAPEPSWPRRFLLQFHNVLIYVLLAAGALTAALGDWADAAVIAAVVLVNAVVGHVQEGKAAAALRAIRGMLTLEAMAVRGGARRALAATELVPGDVVLLRSGDRVPADLRLLDARSLRVEEAALTGEAVPAEKGAAPVPADAPLGDRASMAFSGTLVAHGQGTGVAVATGAATEIGRIGAMLGGIEELGTPLVRQVAGFSRALAVLILAIAALVLGIGRLGHGLPLREMLSAAVGLAVAAIPEGLPAVMTITLAIGVRRMARRNAIVRRLPAVETLGSVGVICSDKTGTLTRNEMTVEALVTAAGRFAVSGQGYEPKGTVTPLEGLPPPGAGGALLAEVALGAALCNEARLRRDGTGWRVDGDPMEGALLALAAKLGLDPGRAPEGHRRRDAIPFESEREFMATLNDHPRDGRVVHLKGAPERLLVLCDRQRTADGTAPIDPAWWRTRIAELAREGQRVLGLARSGWGLRDEPLGPAEVERGGFTFLGLLGLRDPPRAEAQAAVAACRAAGVRVKMITGDHPDTARAIAARLDLANSGAALTGGDLDRLDPAGFGRAAAEVDVFARATPEHKLRLVEALQAQGHVVAMTGDGVNDAPALKRADVGVAMGRRGTEAAKEAAQVVLADDNFATIARAVEEGRVVRDNLEKALLFLLGTNAAQALTVAVAVVLGHHLPITAPQILWVNMVTAVTLGLALAFEVAEPGVMRRPPRPADAPLVGWAVGGRVLLFGTLAVAATLLQFELELRRTDGGLAAARTLALNTLVACEIAYLLGVRRGLAPALSAAAVRGIGPALLATGLIVLLQLLLTYAAPLRAVFGTVPLEAGAWLPILASAAVVLAAVEAEKLVLRRRRAEGARTGLPAAGTGGKLGHSTSRGSR